jgi:SAM-dependent methyltransferase
LDAAKLQPFWEKISMSSCCVCCSKQIEKVFTAKEMMYGTREQFQYQQCGTCGSVQIAEIPVDLGKYYPENYYSMATQARRSLPSRVKGWLILQRDRHLLGMPNSLGRFMAYVRPPDSTLRALQASGAKRTDRIVDVGCGAAADFLRRLVEIGFCNVSGADPFVATVTVHHKGFAISKASLEGLTGPFELITLHHSFEHFPEPRKAMKEIHRLLVPGGACILRLPTPSSDAYDRYGANWVQLDAPRHLVLPSRKGVEILASEHGMEIVFAQDDSGGFQFAGSELYEQDIPLLPALHSYNAEKLGRHETTAKQLNAKSRGDQVAYVLRKRQ